MTHRFPLVSALLGLGVALAPASRAEQGPPPGPRLTPQQQAQIFPEQKQLWLRHARDRIAALQTGETCVRAARTAATLKACLKQERQANMALRRSHRAEMQALLARYGIALPEPRDEEGAGKPHGGPGAPSGGWGGKT